MPGDAATPSAILQAIEDLHVTGMSSATDAFARSGEDGIAISDSNDEEDADGLQFQTMSHKYNLPRVGSSPQKRKAMASSGFCLAPAASSSTPNRAKQPKGMGERPRDSPIRGASVGSGTPRAKRPQGVRTAPESEISKQDTPWQE